MTVKTDRTRANHVEILILVIFERFSAVKPCVGAQLNWQWACSSFTAQRFAKSKLTAQMAEW